MRQGRVRTADPFDIIPRLISRTNGPGWKPASSNGSKHQPLLADIYGPQEIIKSGIVPADIILTNPHFRHEMIGARVPHNIYVHIAGIDLVRTGENDFFVLEDNVRTPSGVSYMLENREVMMRLVPDLFAGHQVAPVENYPDLLLASLRSVAPSTASLEPVIALLTPGQYNSAYYEHSFLR